MNRRSKYRSIILLSVLFILLQIKTESQAQQIQNYNTMEFIKNSGYQSVDGLVPELRNAMSFRNQFINAAYDDQANLDSIRKIKNPSYAEPVAVLFIKKSDNQITEKKFIRVSGVNTANTLSEAKSIIIVTLSKATENNSKRSSIEMFVNDCQKTISKHMIKLDEFNKSIPSDVPWISLTNEALGRIKNLNYAPSDLSMVSIAFHSKQIIEDLNSGQKNPVLYKTVRTASELAPLDKARLSGYLSTDVKGFVTMTEKYPGGGVLLSANSCIEPDKDKWLTVFMYSYNYRTVGKYDNGQDALACDNNIYFVDKKGNIVMSYSRESKPPLGTIYKSSGNLNNISYRDIISEVFGQ